jgi:hypothetical protein
MPTTIRAILLGLALAPLSVLGTIVVLTILLFGATGPQPLLEMVVLLLIALLPAALLSGISATLPIHASYKKAIALGLCLPTVAVCLWYGIAFSSHRPMV